MAVGFPAKTDFATGEVLTATNMNDITGTLNLLQSTLYPAGRNKIINGDFNINQRAFTSVTANGVFTFDRFKTTNGGTSGTATYTPQTFTPGAAPVAGYESKNLLQILTASYTVADSWGGIAQHIESVRTFAGQTVVFSFWAKAASGTPKLGIRVQQDFGSGGSPSTAVSTYATITAISTSWVRYSATISVPSISGKTVGTAGDDAIKFTLVVSAGSTTFDGAFGSMLQNNTFQTWGWQVEAASTGSTASPFQTASGSIGGELALCQRYYVRFNASASGPYAVFAPSGMTASTTQSINYTNLPVELRSYPSSVEYGGTLVVMSTATSQTVTSIALQDRTSNKIVSITYTVASGLTTNQYSSVRAENSATAYLGISAEI
jgi:hypothetical protein